MIHLKHPLIYEKKWYPWIDGTSVYSWNIVDKLCGGNYCEVEIPVIVLAIQYSCNNNFIFELQKLKS